MASPQVTALIASLNQNKASSLPTEVICAIDLLVTALQTLDTAAGNATSLQGNAVSNAAPADTNVLTWVAANNDWEPKPSGALVAGNPPTIVQSKLGFVTAAGLTLSSAPINGNLLVAMFFNPTTASVGAGWTAVASNVSGVDNGVIAIKVAGAGESATQNPVGSSVTGIIAIWELNGQDGTIPVIYAATQVEQSSLTAQAPGAPTAKDCLALACVSLVSTSNNISEVAGMVQDQVINTGSTRQGVMLHATAALPFAQPLVSFTGSGTPGNKSGVIVIS